MPVFKSYVLGMAMAHLLWLYFFTTGHLLRRKALEQSRSFLITDLVITSVAGMAVAGFCLLLLGFTHLLNRPVRSEAGELLPFSKLALRLAYVSGSPGLFYSG